MLLLLLLFMSLLLLLLLLLLMLLMVLVPGVQPNTFIAIIIAGRRQFLIAIGHCPILNNCNCGLPNWEKL